MNATGAMILHLLQLLILFVPAGVLAWLLRRAAVPGGPRAAALTAGMFIGLLAGPGVLGRLKPDFYDRIFVGAAQETRAWRELLVRQRLELLAMREAGADEPALAAMVRRHGQDSAPITQARAEALADHRTRLDLVAQSVLALFAATIAPALLPNRSRPVERLARAVVSTGRRAIIPGLIAMPLAIPLPMLTYMLIMGSGVRESLALALCLSAQGIAASLRPGIYIACAFAMFVCLATALVIGWSVGMTIVGAGFLFGLLMTVGFVSRTVRSRSIALAHGVLLPAVAAFAAVRLDLVEFATGASSQVFWTAAIIALLWSSDGRWIVWFLAWRSVGAGLKPIAWTCSTSCVNAGCGVAQTAMTLVLASSGLFGQPVAAALLLGALLVELTCEARRWLAARLDAHARDPA